MSTAFAVLTMAPSFLNVPTVEPNVQQDRICLAGATVALYAAAILSDESPAALESRRVHMLAHESHPPLALLAQCDTLIMTESEESAVAEPGLRADDLLRPDAQICFPAVNDNDNRAQVTPTTLATRAGVESRLPPLLQFYDDSLRAHALPTKAATGAAVFALASASSQALSSSSRRIDPFIVGQMSAFGLLIDSPLQHTWHNLLETVLPGTAAWIVCEKIMIDQLFMAPCQLSIYLVATAVLSGGRLAEGMVRIRAELLNVFRVHTAFWCAAHAVTFGLMPLEYRMPWCTCCNLAYVTILALLTQSSTQQSPVLKSQQTPLYGSIQEPYRHIETNGRQRAPDVGDGGT